MSQGRVRYHVLAQTALNPSLLDPANQQCIREHVSSLGTYSPNPGDGIAKWYPEALAYIDAYSIYTTVKDAGGADIPNPLVAEHPEWILKSASGKPLYIPWGQKDASGNLSQYAGNFSSPEFCGYQIARMKAAMALGYRGIWLDDVNIPVRCTEGTTDANGYVSVLPADWSAPFWAKNMGNLVRVIRAALSDTAIIVHNAVWTADINRAQIAACNYFYLERGMTDPGLTGGSGQYSVQKFFSFIDACHALDTPVIFGDYDNATMEYSVAGWLLISEDGDMLGFANQPLAEPWPGLLSLDLGAAKGPRKHTGGLWSRQFDRGAAYLLEPGAAPVSFTLLPPAYDSNGNVITSISLGPAQGKVIRFEA